MRTAWRTLLFTVLAAMGAANLVCVGKRVPPPPIFVEQAAMIDEVTRAENRFHRVRVAVRERGITGAIGYIESTRGAELDIFVGNSFLAQFVLLPVVLDPDLRQRQWAIANFSPSVSAGIPDGWRVAEDCGGGVLLLAREAQ